MATKTISIMQDVYKLLLARKRRGESFSAVIRRFLRRSRSVMEFDGAWSRLTAQDAEDLKGAIKKLRRTSTRELLKAT